MEKSYINELREFIVRESPTPLYIQFKEFLLEKINNGDLVEDELLPTEFEFQRLVGISRTTIRQALGELENEGYIKRERRQGTKVYTKKIITQGNILTGFSEDTKIRGSVPSSKTLELDYIFPPKKIIELSGFGSQEKVWFIKRLRYADNEPVGIHDLYIPPNLNIAPIDLKNMISYYELLIGKLNLPPIRATETLMAMSATTKEAGFLKIRKGAPVLQIYRVTYSTSDQIVEVVRMINKGERHEYRDQLFRE